MAKSVTRQRVANACLLEYANKNRDDGYFNDVTITAGNQSIPANRLVLSCYSAYFENMFKSSMRERYERIIKVQAIDGQSLKTLIDYIYSGSIDISNQNVLSLLSGADYLQLEEVKQFCFEYLRANITPENSVNILEAASLYKCEALKEEVQQYISVHLDEVAQTDDFKTYSKAKLIDCISFLVQNNATPDSVYDAIITWIHQNDEKRKLQFPELFKMVNLLSMSLDFLEETVLEDELLANSFECQKLALKAYRRKLSRAKIVLNESKLLSLGGSNTLSKAVIVFNLLNQTTEVTTKYPDLIQGLVGHSSLKLKEYLYVIGGNVNRDYDADDTNHVWKLNLRKPSPKWEQVASMNANRSLMGAAVYDDTIVIAGGEGEDDQSVETFLPIVNEWKNLSPMNEGRYGHSLVVCDEYLYALGGCCNDKFLSSAEKIKNLKGNWKIIKSMQKSRGYLAAVNCNEVIYAIGGTFGDEDSTTLKTVEKYDPAANQWVYVSCMNFARSSHAVSVLQRKIYVVGGIDDKGNYVKEIECYDPANDTWSIVGEVSDELCNHSLVTL